MALDKQKILNELGNVVSQLQSADCGCMGKLFSNSNQANPNMASPAHNGFMRGCCHGHGCGHACHGYNAAGAGEPYSGNRHCMGFCNPPKLYADTYNYLNQNLMQPAVKEVYSDLKSITPANTMLNNPMGAQMGLSQGNVPNPSGAGNMGNMMAQNQMSGGAMGSQNPISNHGPNVRFGNVDLDNTNNANTMQMGSPNNQQQMGQPMPAGMAGMGPHIVNMMMGDAGARTASQPPNQGGSQAGAMGLNTQQSPEMGMTSNMPSDAGQEQYNAANMQYGNNPGQYNNTGNIGMHNMGMNNIGQGHSGAPFQNPTTQYMSQPDMSAGANANMQGHPMAGNVSQMNPGSQQIRTAPPAHQQINSRSPYGQHTAGITKFNEMFPGVMQGGDLGFDPMAIAIQMNPANQQRAAMDTMQKMMMSNGEGINRVNASMLQPVINATNAAAASISQSNQPPANQDPGQQTLAHASMQQLPRANAQDVQHNQVPQQQVYSAVTGAPTMNQQQASQQELPTQQQQYQQQYQGHYQQSNQQMVDPNTGAVLTGALSTVYEGSVAPNASQGESPPTQSAPITTPAQQMIKEPIFPADTSRNMPSFYINMKPQKDYHYNTLGQPVEMLPARVYHTPEPSLPQTLSPQPTASKLKGDPTRYSNVKATISKTSLMGNKPVGRIPSRSQLQQIYNQYKGSQSYTQQNIKPPDNGASYSEGHLKVPHGNVQHRVPIEKVGGDTAANNTMDNLVVYKEETNPSQVGDVPTANKPLADAEKKPANQSRVRNGLQDMTYTTYTSSAAWSFHGATPSSYPTEYRYRNKV